MGIKVEAVSNYFAKDQFLDQINQKGEAGLIHTLEVAHIGGAHTIRASLAEARSNAGIGGTDELANMMTATANRESWSR